MSTLYVFEYISILGIVDPTYCMHNTQPPKKERKEERKETTKLTGLNKNVYHKDSSGYTLANWIHVVTVLSVL